MDSKKTTKKTAKKNGGNKKLTATQLGDVLDKAVTAKAAATAKTAKAKKASAGAVKNFLFSIPSLHSESDESNFEHLVIASSVDEAAKMLAESRCTEKWPDMSDQQRAFRVALMTQDYAHRKVIMVEPRKEAATVVQVNHKKSGNGKGGPTPETLTLN